mmetsp:Transcript_18898/g.23045  ORF Transcript_18898/g.23045 Transcript_18898/m.23045 type:complete len:187 (-) Transcript_18898:2746-3306(-)|eukprot:CAMPEP_0204822908 /NCGR_PEP_ID=MMETSP1346-20131115/1092_1 /ASSEMBLY_ACC=CAM_ASM_000771 /TAXON_ID=215587 /ORGANISM="Aplanochytrium stocchinoi, Strain GSBS06" /LENGTH=186 /DNA_ID=CAMNT_0051949381 /DNA_START=381 /DNA_END=941 /DNA_ORIENTATION=-
MKPIQDGDGDDVETDKNHQVHVDVAEVSSAGQRTDEVHQSTGISNGFQNIVLDGKIQHAIHTNTPLSLTKTERICEFCRRFGSTRKDRIYSGHKLLLVTECEVRKHRNETSCWIIADGFVFDVTSYMDEHPGGSSCLFKRSIALADAGEDRLFHSTGAKKQWEKLKIAKFVACQGPDPNEDMCVIQ